MSESFDEVAVKSFAQNYGNEFTVNSLTLKPLHNIVNTSMLCYSAVLLQMEQFFGNTMTCGV